MPHDTPSLLHGLVLDEPDEGEALEFSSNSIHGDKFVLFQCSYETTLELLKTYPEGMAQQCAACDVRGACMDGEAWSLPCGERIDVTCRRAQNDSDGLLVVFKHLRNVRRLPQSYDTAQVPFETQAK